MTTKPKPTEGTLPPDMTTPTTINDITDLLRILRENPEWLDQVRNVVLTQEILELPATLAALTQEVREFIAEQRAINQEQKRTNDAIFARLDRIEADVAEAKTDIKELKSDMAEAKADIKELKSDMAEAKTDIKELKTTVSSLVTTTNRLDSKVGQLLGADAERKVHANIHGFLRRHDRSLHHIGILKSINHSFDEALLEEIAEAFAAGLITEQEEDSVQLLDLIVRARSRGSNQAIYHVIEVSVVVDEHDVQRAVDRADILSRATNTKTVPVTVGGVVIPAAATLAETHGVVTITTTQLTPPQNQTIPTDQ